MAKRKFTTNEESSPEFHIDKHALDDELVRQVDMMEAYAARLVVAEEKYEKYLKQLKEISSKLEQRIRTKPGKFGIDKVTEGAIKAALSCQEEYQTANQNLTEVSLAISALKGKINVLSGRKSMLGKLCDLWMMSYFSSPSQKSKDFRDEAIRKKTQNEVTDQLKNRKKRRKIEEDEDEDDDD